jgi:hypothetical protein
MVANAGAATVYLKFDDSSTTLTAANGFPLLQNTMIDLSAWSPNEVRAISAGSVDCRVQGD